MLAAPGTKDYGVLTLGVAARARAGLCFTLPPGAFRPPPKVRSAVVRIAPLASPPVAPESLDGFMAVVRAALGRRRKTLRNALATLDLPPERIAAALAAAGIDPGARGETLELADVPDFAQNMGLVLILAGALSLAFMGFAGLFSAA